MTLAILIACLLLAAVPMLWAAWTGRLPYYRAGALVWGAGAALRTWSAPFVWDAVGLGWWLEGVPPAAALALAVHSALCELGLAGLFMRLARRGRHTAASMVAFGLGGRGVAVLVFAVVPALRSLGEASGAPNGGEAALFFLEHLVGLFGGAAVCALLSAGLVWPAPVRWAPAAAFVLFVLMSALEEAVWWPRRDEVVHLTYCGMSAGVFALMAYLACIAHRRRSKRLRARVPGDTATV